MRVRNIAIFSAAVLAGALGGSLVGPRPAEAVAREIIGYLLISDDGPGDELWKERFEQGEAEKRV